MPARKKPAPKVMVPAHPDLEAGILRLHDEGRDLPMAEDEPEAKKHPLYHEVLTELLAKKVPAS